MTVPDATAQPALPSVAPSPVRDLAGIPDRSRTPRPVFNLMMALWHVGVPLGGALAALSVPSMVVSIGCRGTLWAE